jgi:hypothetical protein
MKKLVTIGAVVVIAAVFFGCAEQAFEDEPEYDEQGRRLVSFSVPTGSYSSGGGALGHSRNPMRRRLGTTLKSSFTKAMSIT